MKRFNFKLVGFFVAVIASFLSLESCSKNRIEDEKKMNEYSSINSYMDTKKNWY